MSPFRIAHSRFGSAPRVYHESDNSLAVALILSEEDGSVTLFPTKFQNLPLPLTGASMSFPSEEEVREFLGIAEERVAA